MGVLLSHWKFSSVKICTKASWRWISVLAGHDVLYQVVRKQLGDGVSTFVREDPLVPSIPQFKIQSSKPQGTTLCYVCELIQENN